jgi:hypothetical protein
VGREGPATGVLRGSAVGCDNTQPAARPRGHRWAVGRAAGPGWVGVGGGGWGWWVERWEVTEALRVHEMVPGVAAADPLRSAPQVSRCSELRQGGAFVFASSPTPTAPRRTPLFLYVFLFLIKPAVSPRNQKQKG